LAASLCAVFQLVVPANAGTHNHRHYLLAKPPLQHLATQAFVVMDPGAEAGTTASVLMQIFQTTPAVIARLDRATQYSRDASD
jgi:hypothetical protein